MFIYIYMYTYIYIVVYIFLYTVLIPGIFSNSLLTIGLKYLPKKGVILFFLGDYSKNIAGMLFGTGPSPNPPTPAPLMPLL